jgi:hypothetical protein
MSMSGTTRALTPARRDAGLRRLRVLNRFLIGAAVVATGLLTDVAAKAFPGHKRAVRTSSAARPTFGATSGVTATHHGRHHARRLRHAAHHTLSAPAQAPATSTAPASAPPASTPAPQPTVTQSAPAPAPAPSPAPVVSGGS